MTKKLTLNKWFSLPRLGKDAFAELMRFKVKYDTKFGFMLVSSTNVERALSTISSSLDEEVVLTSACFICNSPVDEVTPGGDEITGAEQSATLCAECLRNEEAFDLYKIQFVKLMESL